MKVKTISLTRQREVHPQAVKATPPIENFYVSKARGICRATGGIAHPIIEKIATNGMHYYADAVTDCKINPALSSATKARRHETKILHLVKNLLDKANTKGLTALEFEKLWNLSIEDEIQSNWKLMQEIAIVCTGRQFDVGKIITRK